MMKMMANLDNQESRSKHEMSISAGSWVKGVIVVALALVLFFLRDVVLIIVASIVIASAIEPAAIWAKRKGVPRLPTILSVYIISAILFAGLFYFLFLPLLGELSAFVTQFPEYASSLSGHIGFGPSISAVEITDQLNSLFLSLSQGAVVSASLFFGGITSFLLVIILSFYLAVQDDGIGKFLRIVTPLKQERYVIDLWSRSRHKIGLWMQGQLLLAVIIAILVYLGLLLLGVPHALLLAITAGLLEIIPLFGPIIAAIPAVLLGFNSGGMSLALIIIGLFIIIQQFENQLIYPLVVKKVIGVPPMVSILALLIGFELAGFLGLLISVPLATVLLEFVSDLEKEKFAQMSAFGVRSSVKGSS